MSSKSAAIKPIDPTEWANRRKAAVERARLKREELKSGITQDEHTFAPQINKRPAYLDTTKNKDSLDTLAADYVSPSNNIFEKPLPGNKSYTENANRKPPSPNSDALGREINRYPKNESSNSNIPLDVHNNNNNYNYNNNINSNKVDDSDLFMNLLRSDNKKSAGPGWNDDFTSANAFDNMKKPPNGRKSRVISNNKPDINEQPRQRNIDKPKENENWNNEFNLDLPIKPMKTSPTISPRLNNDQLAISQARSKLHILKSKIRRSESGGSARPQPDESFTSAKSDSLVNIIPKSAPYDFNNDPYKRGNEMPITNTLDKRNNNNNSNNKTIESISQSNYQPSFQSNKPPIRKPINRYENENIDSNPHNGKSSPRINNTTNKVDNDYDEDDDDNNQNNLTEYENLELFECPDCGRKFNEIALQKHAKICAKVFLQKRKVFDTTKMRIQDNPELVNLLKEKKKRTRNVKSTTQIETPATAILRNREDAPINGEKQSKWKEQSKQFRDVMKQARLASQAMKNGDPLPPVVMSAPDPSLIQCPHCERRFNEKAAERHIPLCTNIRAKPNSLKRGQGGGGGINGTLASSNNSAMKKSIRR